MGTQGNKPCHWVHIAAPKSQGTIVLLVQQLQRATNNWSSNLVFYTVNQCSLGYIRAVITGALLVQEFCDLWFWAVIQSAYGTVTYRMATWCGVLRHTRQQTLSLAALLMVSQLWYEPLSVNCKWIVIWSVLFWATCDISAWSCVLKCDDKVWNKGNQTLLPTQGFLMSVNFWLVCKQSKCLLISMCLLTCWFQQHCGSWLMVMIALYNTIFCSRADSLCLHAILHGWITFCGASEKKIHCSGVLTANAWLVPHKTAAALAIQPCHFMQSHMCKVYACLPVTCHLHFW